MITADHANARDAAARLLRAGALACQSIRASASRIPLPPGPASPAIAQLIGYMRDPIGYLLRCRARYGPVFTLRWPGMPPLIYFAELTAIAEIFRASPDVLRGGRSNAVLDFIAGPRSVARLDGPAHRRRRRTMVSPFTRLGPSYAAAMAAGAIEALEAARGREVSFQATSQALSLRNLIHCAVGVDDRGEAARLHALMLTFTRESLNPVMAAMWMLFPGVALRRRLTALAPLAGRPLAGRVPFVALADAINRLDALLYAAIRRARADPSRAARVDVLSLLVGADAALDDAEIRDELMAILVAGHETTSTTMDWFMVEALARPALLRALRDEADRVIGGGPFDVSLLERLPTFTATIHECLRLHPPVPAVGRFVARDHEIAGVPVPAGVVVSPSIVLAHLDPASWPDPTAFRPERFLEDAAAQRRLIPFGGGTRTCLGRPFGLFQLQVVLATVIARYTLVPREWPAPRLVQRGLFTGVDHPVRVAVQRR